MMERRSLWRGTVPLVLASTSPTRRKLLESAGLAVHTRVPRVDERALEGALRPQGAVEVALVLAREKALSVSRAEPQAIVVGADQTLICHGMRFYKPVDRAAAISQLTALAGRTHILHAAFALAEGGQIRHDGVEAARMTMRQLTPAAIERYVDLAGDAALAGVGAYQVEGLGIHLFQRVEGEHSTILGFPLLPFLKALRAMDLLDL